MAASRSNNTMAEGLYKTLSQIAQMATAPDADLQFLTKLQVEITQYLRSYSPGGGGGQPQPGMPGQGGPPPGMMTGGGMQGLSQAPNMDEIARLFGGGSQ